MLAGHIAPFYEFNNRKWDLINSQKVCVIAFARLQGIKALLKRFRDSPVAKGGMALIIDPISGGCASLAQIHAATKSAVTIGGMQEARSPSPRPRPPARSPNRRRISQGRHHPLPLAADSLARTTRWPPPPPPRRVPTTRRSGHKRVVATRRRRRRPWGGSAGAARLTRRRTTSSPTSQVRATAAAQRAANEQALAVAAAATLYAEQASSSDAKIDDATPNNSCHRGGCGVQCHPTQVWAPEQAYPSAVRARRLWPVPSRRDVQEVSASRVASAGNSDAPRIDDSRRARWGLQSRRRKRTAAIMVLEGLSLV